MNWLQVAVESVVDKLTFAFELFDGDKEKAIEYVKKQTCAGPLAWEKAFESLGW